MNVGLVVLGGGLATLEPYRSNVEAAARREAFEEIQIDCRFELAATGYEAGVMGAALLGQEAAAEQQSRNRVAA